MLLLSGKSRDLLNASKGPDDSAHLPRISKHNQTGPKRVRLLPIHTCVYSWKEANQLHKISVFPLRAISFHPVSATVLSTHQANQAHGKPKHQKQRGAAIVHHGRGTHQGGPNELDSLRYCAHLDIEAALSVTDPPTLGSNLYTCWVRVYACLCLRVCASNPQTLGSFMHVLMASECVWTCERLPGYIPRGVLVWV